MLMFFMIRYIRDMLQFVLLSSYISKSNTLKHIVTNIAIKKKANTTQCIVLFKIFKIQITLLKAIKPKVEHVLCAFSKLSTLKI